MKRRSLAGGVTSMGLLFASLVCGAAAPDQAGGGYAASKRSALAATEQEYARIVAGRPKDPALVRLRERLAAVDRAAELVVRRLEAIRAGTMEKWIDDLPGRSAPAVAAPAPAVRVS